MLNSLLTSVQTSLNMSHSAFFQQRNQAKLCRALSQQSAEDLVNTYMYIRYVTFRIDY